MNANPRCGVFRPPKNICAHIYDGSYNKQDMNEDLRSVIFCPPKSVNTYIYDVNFENYIQQDMNGYLRCGVSRPPSTNVYLCLHDENFELHVTQMYSRPAVMTYECPNDENLETHVMPMCFLHPRCGLSGPQFPCRTPRIPSASRPGRLPLRIL